MFDRQIAFRGAIAAMTRRRRASWSNRQLVDEARAVWSAVQSCVTRLLTSSKVRLRAGSMFRTSNQISAAVLGRDRIVIDTNVGRKNGLQHGLLIFTQIRNRLTRFVVTLRVDLHRSCGPKPDSLGRIGDRLATGALVFDLVVNFAEVLMRAEDRKLLVSDVFTATSGMTIFGMIFWTCRIAQPNCVFTGLETPFVGNAKTPPPQRLLSTRLASVMVPRSVSFGASLRSAISASKVSPRRASLSRVGRLFVREDDLLDLPLFGLRITLVLDLVVALFDLSVADRVRSGFDVRQTCRTSPKAG